MKKILLTLLSFIAFTGVYAQSLSLVVYDHQTKEELATLKSGDTYDVNILYYEEVGQWEIPSVYFYVKNNSEKSGTANFTHYEGLTEKAKEIHLGVCENVCYTGVTLPKDMELGPNGEYRGLNGSMDFQFSAMGVDLSGNGDISFNVYLKFSEDDEPCVFRLRLTEASSGINSSSVEKSLNVYQSGTGVVANYSFDNAAERYISVYNLAGEIVGKFKLAGEAGNEVLPVSLSKGIYLYALEENGKSLKAHKFIVK